MDYQDPTKVINGAALLAQMVRFLPDQVETCFGTVDTMKRIQAYEEASGIAVMDVLYPLDPQQIAIIFGDNGSLLQETPTGTGALEAITPPFPLPSNAIMRSTAAGNVLRMAFSDGQKGLVPPIALNGVLGGMSTAQNPLGGPWSQYLFYMVGDLVRSPDGRWWRCTSPSTAFGSPNGPQWPQQNGHFSGGVNGNPPTSGTWTPATAQDPTGDSEWEEWTPACQQYMPAPDFVTVAPATSDNPGGGTLPAGQDIYVKLTYFIPGVGEGPRSIAAVFKNTAANDAVTLTFSTDAAGGPCMPRWLAEMVLQPARFNPFYLNVYVAAVATGTAAPNDAAYGLSASGASVGAPVVITGTGTATTSGIFGAVLTKGTGVQFPQGTNPPFISVAGDGSGAQLSFTYTAVINPGQPPPHFVPPSITLVVTGIKIANPGFGYTVVPEVVFTGDNAGDFAATVQISSVAALPPSLAAIAPAMIGSNLPTAFFGETGARYMVVTRFNQNGSLAPIDPNSAIPCNFIGQIQMPIVNIVRSVAGKVECTVGDVTVGWITGRSVVVGGCTTDGTFNGTFDLDNVQATLTPQGILSWLDESHETASNDDTGYVTMPAGPPPVAFLPPGGPNDLEDIAAFTIVNDSSDGPFFYISESDVEPFTSAVSALEGPLVIDLPALELTRDAGGMVTCTVTDISGLASGNLITVSGATPDASFDGQYSLAGVTVGTGTQGTLTWVQDDDNPSTASARVVAQINDQGSIQITVQNPSGFTAGDACVLDTGSKAATGQASPFDGMVILASITDNVITAASLATGTPTLYPGASLTIIQNLPTCSRAGGVQVTSITRDAAGNVVATVENVGGFAQGQTVQVSIPAAPSFNGLPQILEVVTNPDGFTGSLSWVQTGQQPASDDSGTGIISSVPDLLVNYQDELLEEEEGNEVTPQLTMSPPPPSVDVYLVPSLNKFVYTRGTDSLFLFSETGDAENIDLLNGSLSVDDNSQSLAICVREARTGEIIALKADSGYAVNPSDLSPAEWPCPQRWKEHGPPCAAAVGKGTDFLVFPSFWSIDGVFLYMDGKLDWLTKEFSQVWNQVNKQALTSIWTVVDEQEKEVLIGVPLGDATSPSHVIVGSYIEGWGPQEVLNRYGKLITSRSALRWSIRPRAIRTAAVVQRALAAPQPGLSAPYPVASLTRTNGLVVASYPNAGAVPPVQSPGGTIAIEEATDSSFDGSFTTVEYSGPGFSLAWLQTPLGPALTILRWDWSSGLSGVGAGVIVISGAPPAYAQPGVKIYVQGTNSELDGMVFTVGTVGVFPTYFSLVFDLKAVFTPDSDVGSNGQVVLFNPLANSVASAQSFATSEVPAPPTDERVQTRQLLMGPSSPDPDASVVVVSADRRTGPRGDGTVGGVVTFRYSGPLPGDVSEVIVSGMKDQTFDGVYDEPCTAAWGGDGVHNILQFKTTGPTGVSYGGIMQSTMTVLRVVMQVPERYDDNGAALDSRYIPAFSHDDQLSVIRWGAFMVQINGEGTMQLLPLTEDYFTDDPSNPLEPETVILDGNGKPTRRTIGLNVPDNEYLTLQVSNGNTAGAYFKLQDVKLYGTPIFSGRNN